MDNGWREYQRLVLSELKRLSGEQEKMRKELEALRVDFATMRVKNTAMGAIGGAIPAALAVLYMIMSR